MSADREPSTEALSATTPIEEAVAAARSLVGLWRLNPASTGINAAIADLAAALEPVSLRTLDREREVRSDLARQVAGLPGLGKSEWLGAAVDRAAVLAILAGTDATPEPDR